MQSDSKSNLLTIRLWREVIVRNRFSGLIHLLLVLLATVFCWDMHRSSPLTLIPYGFVLLGCCYRTLLYQQIKSLDEIPGHLRCFHHLCLLFIGIGWGIFWYDSHMFYGRFSIHGMFAFLTLSAFISGAVPSNAPRPMGYLCLAVPMALIPTVQFLQSGGTETKFIAICIVMYLMFNIYQLNIGYTYIRQYIEKDLTTTQDRDKLQTLLDTVPGFVGIINQDLRYISMNETAQDFFNLHDYYMQHIGVPNPDSEYVRFITRFMKGDKFTEVTEIKLELHPGYCHAILRIQKMKPPHGGALVVAIPIDELVNSREKLKEQEAKAFYNSKLISLGEMAAGIAHEINNPLAIILGSSDQIVRELKKTGSQLPRVEMLTEKIQKTVERISLIIKSLRILARNGERDPYVSFRLNSIIEPSLEVSRQRFMEENVDLIYEAPSEELTCIGQEIQLSQVVMNLLTNAFDAALEGALPRWVRMKVMSTQNYIDIYVQDSGPGIPLEIRKKIMEPFFTTKPINKGTGLGLSISKSIMEQHGGALILDESAENTTFIMRIKKPQITA